MIELGKTYKDCYGTDMRIICVDRGGYWSVVGLVDNDILRIYTAEGKLNKSDESPYDLIIPEDYSTYKVDEPVMVRASEANEWKRMHFADVVNGMPYAWVNGETSWTTNTAGNWNQCRRPTTEELEVRNEL